jgi:putative DNA methylase
MLIDRQFDAAFANEMAVMESYNKHLYRPNSYLHKWWARRCGTTFRALLKHLATDEAQQDYYAPGGLAGKIILDPMMGGGTTLHEAIRLEANVVGADIDPIPVLQARATLSAAPLADLQAAFAEFYAALSADLAGDYQTHCPDCAVKLPWQFRLYGMRRRCACREVLAVDSLILRHNADDSIISVDPDSGAILRDGRPTSHLDAPPNHRLIEKGDKICPDCQRPYQENLNRPYYQRYAPFAVMGECPRHGLFFAAAAAAADHERDGLPFDPADFAILPGPKSRSLLDRGIKSYLDLFSGRQLRFLARAIELLPRFEPLIRLNLALLVSTSLEFNSLLCGYKGARKKRPGAIRHVFAHHAYSFPYTAAENNPLYPQKASGNLRNLFFSRIVRGRQWAANPEERRLGNGRIQKVIVKGEKDAGVETANFADLQSGTRRFMLIQGSSAALDLPDDSVDFVVTDPPYFDSVQYSDLAAFFRVWLRQLAPTDVDWHYNLDKAAVDQRANGSSQYDQVLGDIFAECRRVLKPDGRLIFTFHHWNPKGWATITKTVKRAGFVLVNRYVVHAENQSSVHIVNQNALLHDVALVLAPVESGLRPAWTPPERVNMSDSYAFCEDCGAIIGWLLSRDMTETAVDDHWQTFLADKG